MVFSYSSLIEKPDHQSNMSDTRSPDELNAMEERELVYEEVDEEDDETGDETETEDLPDESNESNEDSSTLQVTSLSHELTNPILKCLANIEIPYRCLYMSCGNFYSTKSQMISHMRCDHGLEINLMPSVNCTINSRYNSLQPLLRHHVKTASSNSEANCRRHVGGKREEEEEEEVQSHQQEGGTGQVRGHVRHKCPYAQCFTCPHCYSCYSTAYRLTLHVKCSHRHVVGMHGAQQFAQQFAQQEQQRATMSSKANTASHIPLINLVKSSDSETTGKMKRPMDKSSE